MRDRLRRLRRRARSLPAWQADAVLAAIALALVVVEITATGAPARDTRIMLALAPLIAVAVLVRRRAPIAAIALGMTLIVVAGLLDRRITETAGSPYLLTVLLVFSMAARIDGRRLWLGAAVALAGGSLGVASDQTPDDLDDTLMMAVISVVLPVTLGQLLRSRGLLTGALREKAARAEERRDREATAAVAEERERIAGELHDVVTHALGAMTIQASAARRLAPGDPGLARDALRAVEETGRDALTELRRLLGVLRREDEELALAPQPRLANLSDLVRRTAAAGLPATLTVEGDAPGSLTAGADLTGYRIVQEALRSAIEAGGAGRARVLVRYSPSDIAIEVADDGRRSRPGAMLGMRERVRVHGGDLSAGPGPGGHVLRARLPLEARA